MKVLFISPPNYRFRGASAQMFPVGPLFLCATLKSDHDVLFYDAEGPSLKEQEEGSSHYSSYGDLISSHHRYIEGLNDESHPIWAEVAQVIRDFEPDIVGLTCMTPSYPSALVIAGIVKRTTNALVLMGGVHAMLLPDEVVQTGLVDYVVRGEGEETIKEFVAAVERGRSPDGIAGLSYMRDGVVCHTGKRQLVPDLDSLPPLDYGPLLFKERYPVHCFTNVLGGRGCPHHCLFCANHDIWERYRMHSPQRIYDQIVEAYEKYDKSIYFLDDNFMVNKKVYFDICNRMAANIPDIMWRCQSRVDTLSDEKLSVAKESGCWDVKLGIESGSNAILEYMNKKLTVKKAIEGCEQILGHGLQVSVNLMFGLPEETWEDMQATKQLVLDIPANSIAVSKFIPLPGTQFYRDVMQLGLIKDSPPKYEYFDLYSSYYHCNRHVSPEQLKDFYFEIFEIVQKKNAATRIGPPPDRANMHSKETIQVAACQKIQ